METTKKIALYSLLCAAIIFAVCGCTSIAVKKREMKLTTPVFSYESKTEGLAGENAK